MQYLLGFQVEDSVEEDMEEVIIVDNLFARIVANQVNYGNFQHWKFEFKVDTPKFYEDLQPKEILNWY